jgi:MOB kinase activator 1
MLDSGRSDRDQREGRVCDADDVWSAEYVDHLMNWTQAMLDDEAIFPSKIGTSMTWLCHSRFNPTSHPAGVSFPKNFQATIKSIVRRLFRVYAHLYNHHFAQLCALSIEGTSDVFGSKFELWLGVRAQVFLIPP